MRIIIVKQNILFLLKKKKNKAKHFIKKKKQIILLFYFLKLVYDLGRHALGPPKLGHLELKHNPCSNSVLNSGFRNWTPKSKTNI